MKGHDLYKHFTTNLVYQKPWVTVTIYGPNAVVAFESWDSGTIFSHYLSIFTHCSSRIFHVYYFVDKNFIVFTMNIIIS